jgi:hypothetical protein
MASLSPSLSAPVNSIIPRLPHHCSQNFYFLFFIILSGVRLSPLVTAATNGVLYQLQMIDDGNCGAISGMKIGR